MTIKIIVVEVASAVARKGITMTRTFGVEAVSGGTPIERNEEPNRMTPRITRVGAVLAGKKDYLS
jgi:hypothetical protein